MQATRRHMLPPDAETASSSTTPPVDMGALDVVGDRWTLLVIRDLLLGKSRYVDFQASPEHIPTNILADRLKRLEREGLLQRTAYSERPPRFAYHLTDRGRALARAVEALAVWGLEQFPGTVRARRPSA
jgi:DNA-binding HxlR family transcriptional regulator